MFIRHQGAVTQIIFMPGRGVNVTVYFYNPDKKRINDGKRAETMWPAAPPCIRMYLSLYPVTLSVWRKR